MRIAEALQRFRGDIRSRLQEAAGRRSLAALGVAAMLAAAPMAQAQIQNGGFEAGNFSNWTLRDYNRSGAGLSTVPPTSSAQLDLMVTGAPSGGAGVTSVYRSQVLTAPGTADNTGVNGPKYPFSGTASARLGGNGSLKGTSM